MKKDEDKYQNIEELLPRFCDGMTTLEESRLVEEWIAEDEEHLKTVNRIHEIHLAVDTLDVLQHTDMDKVLGKVKRRIDLTAVSWWEWTQRIAAMLSIPLLMACLWQYFDKDDTRLAQMVEVSTNPGMTTTVVLPDSTRVCLNSESTLRYPSRFTGDFRQVELVGEAYFDVTPDKKKRFVVDTECRSKIEVYGTSFNVEAYPEDGKVATTLIEGSVGFIYEDKEGRMKKVNLQPLQKIAYEWEEGNVRLYSTSGETETAWKDGKIIFNNTPMDEILRMLSKRFHVEFVVKNEHLDEYAFTGTFTAQRLERIMEYFKISSKIRWRYIDSGKMENERQKIEIY